jgi:hypothetical protein
MLCQASELLNALLNMFRNRMEKAKSYKSRNRDRRLNRRRVRVGSDSEHVIRYEDNIYSTPGPISV